MLSLGQHPPSNSFLRAGQIADEVRYPLEVYLCVNCALVQLLHVVPAETIFDDYMYLSSSSRPLVNHYAQLASEAVQRFDVKPGEVVVDIGCNDGILLNGYPSSGLVRVGVEPSKVAEIASASGLEIFNDFFGPKVADAIVETHGPAKIATATNVFAHVDEIGRFTEAVSTLLAEDGVFIIEAPYLMDMVDELLFDTIYHEHLCYLSLTPMVPFLKQHGLQAFDVQRVPFGASGPAIRVFVRKNGGQEPPCTAVAEMVADEARWGVSKLERYRGFACRVETVKMELIDIVERLKASGAKIGGYGAPAKGNTLLNHLGFTDSTVERIADATPLKQGKLTPGSHIPIVSEEEFLRQKPDYALLLAWNYLDFFLENSEYIRQGGRFIVPLPEPRIAP